MDLLALGFGNAWLPMFVINIHVPVNVGMFVFCFKLWNTICQDDLVGMKTFIKIGCYILGGLELACYATGLLVIGMLQTGLVDYLLYLTIAIIGVSTIFTSLMIHGVRKFKTYFLNVNISYRILFFTLISIVTLTKTMISQMDSFLPIAV